MHMSLEKSLSCMHHTQGEKNVRENVAQDQERLTQHKQMHRAPANCCFITPSHSFASKDCMAAGQYSREVQACTRKDTKVLELSEPTTRCLSDWP
eukprot:365020-Amphidinium_carterae.1